jgi:cytochrome c oxidase assembly protein subunit 15
VLGGLRVTAMEDAIGMVHGTLAQLFLILVTVIALCLSPFWSDLKTRAREVRMSSSIRWVLLATTFAILGQLMLGAAMRHQHAGLAIPDFPLAHGALYPATDTDSLATYNAQRLDHREFNDIRALDIHLHMAHRFTAVLVTVLMTVSVVLLIRSLDGRFPGVRRLAIVWFGLLVFQLGLGVVTVLKNKPADIATLHVMIGALCLVVGAVLVRISREFSVATKMAVLQSPARSVSGATPETAQ